MNVTDFKIGEDERKNEVSEQQKEEFLIEMNGKKFIDVIKLLPESLPSGKRILWKEVDDGKVLIFVDKHSAKGGNAKSITIKRFIPINELLFEGLGLRFGDGIKLQGGKMKIFGFSNINLEVHKHFLKFAKECFGLNSDEFRLALTIPPHLEVKKIEIKTNISKELSIPRKNFFKIRVLERGNNPIIDIKISSTILGFLSQLLFEKVKNILAENKTFCAAMLKGIIASEGNVSLHTQEKRIREITIAAKEKEKRNFIRSLLLNLGILPDRDKEKESMECVLITGLSNFKLIKEWRLLELHPKKNKDFEFGIKNFKVEQSRKGELRLKVLQLLSQKPMTRKELGKLLNRSPNTIKTEALLILEKQGLVKRGELNSKSRLWKITEKGLEILKVENPLEKLKSRK